jgi:hypothetical protein
VQGVSELVDRFASLISSTWIMGGGKICLQGSKVTDQSVDLVGYPASNFAGAA